MTEILGYISDHETKVDLLNNEAIAKTIINLIQTKSDSPVTIGVHGDWGAGKSSVLEMISASLENQEEVICIKFNGWQFQGFEDAKIALIEGVVTELIANQTVMARASEEIKNVLRRIDWLKVAKKAGGLAFTAFTGVPTLEQMTNVFSTLTQQISDPTKWATLENAQVAHAEMSSLLTEGAESKKVPNEVREFHNAFQELLVKAKIKRLVVLIDDLDRCLPKTAIETLEAIRLFIFLPKTAFIIGADEAMIEYAVKEHFPDLPESVIAQGYAKSYLEKLIQIPFRIPVLGETEMRIYVSLLLIGSVIGEDSVGFEQLLKKAKELLAKPWEGKTLSDTDIKTILTGHQSYNQSVSSVIVLANQISPILASGTKGNPRQAKRFINALNLRLSVSQARGFGDVIKLQILAKLMLAERFFPSSVFEHIATSVGCSEFGVCPELAFIESSPNQDNQPNSTTNIEATTSANQSINADMQIISDWKTRPEVMKWVKIEPKFAQTSLKPYLFVIKDNKNYLNMDDILSPKLRELLEKLASGENMVVRGLNNQLKELLNPDVELLFNALRTQILSSPAFDKVPKALLGFNELVKAHKAYQMRYVETLEELPVKKLGIWAANGYAGVISETVPQEKLDRLLSKWRNEGLPPLRKALEEIQSLNRGGR